MGLLSKAENGTIIRPRFGKGLLNRIVQKQINTENKVFPEEQAVMENLSAGFTRYGVFQGVVLETRTIPIEDFFNRLALMVSFFGVVFKLDSQRCLVLFDSAKDWELIGKHLSKTVPGNAIIGFRANNPKEAFSYLKPYL